MCKNILSRFLILLLLLRPFACAATSQPQVTKINHALVHPESKPMVVAHRACWRLAPENSIQAIEECIRLGIEMVEIDVRRTKDGHLVVIHDKTLDRTTDGQGMVSELTLSELSELKLKEGQGGENASLTSQHVPTLEEALLAAKDKILVNLDAKADIRDDAYLLAKELGVENQILIKMSLSSPDEADLSKTAFFDNTFFMPIVREKSGILANQIASFAEIGPVAFEVIYQTEEQLIAACEAAAAQEARCWVNTLWERLAPGHSDDVAYLNPDAHWGHLIRLGVNMIQTDRPTALLNYLESQNLR